MNAIAKTICIIILIVLVGVVTVIIQVSGKKEKKELIAKVEDGKRFNGNEQSQNNRSASAQEKQNWEEWYYQAQKLAEEMVLLTGGSGGMVKQRNLYLRAEDKFLVNECKENFILKQKRLEEAYKEYYELQKKVEKLPPDAGKRIEKLEDDEFYNKLMQEKL